jgi:integrase
MARRIRRVIEELVLCERNEQALRKTTRDWLRTAHKDILSKLARFGLYTIKEQKTCQYLWDSFVERRTDLTASTIKKHSYGWQHFFKMFSPTEHLEKITQDQLLKWRASLLAKYAPGGVQTHMNTIDEYFNWAVQQDWLEKNPFDGISRGSFVSDKNYRHITKEEYLNLLNACPNQEWRTIIALARMGGLRCPSELEHLRWSDIHWKEGYFRVQSPKTKRYAGHRERNVPLFPVLRTELERHFSAVRPDNDDFMIQQLQGTCWQLRQQFEKITAKAGLGQINCPFNNMRKSRSNEVVREWGQERENLWLGHSYKVMKKHYLRPIDTDFSEFVGATTVDSGKKISMP